MLTNTDPQCFNLAISGTGTLAPSGVLGTNLYHATDPGILYNLYTTVENYVIPGPTLYSGFPSSIAQTSSAATATSAAIVPGGSSGSTTVATTSSVKTSSSSATTVKSTTTSAVASTTSKVASTTTTPAPTGGAGQTLYGQCGGSGWTGPTSCAAGTCTVYNAYYAQCL